MLTTMYTLPLYLQFVHNNNALQAGVKLLPFVGTMAASLLLSGAMAPMAPWYSLFYLIGGIMALVGGILLHLIHGSTSMSYTLGVSVLVSFGCGLFGQTGLTVAQMKAPSPAATPAATAFIGVAQLVGGVISLVMSNSIFLNQATDKIQELLPNQQRRTILEAISGAESTFFQSLEPDIQVVVIRQIVAAIQGVFNMVVAGAALVVVLSLFLKRERLRVAAASVGKEKEELASSAEKLK
jgi:hypothetical protein